MEPACESDAGQRGSAMIVYHRRPPLPRMFGNQGRAEIPVVRGTISKPPSAMSRAVARAADRIWQLAETTKDERLAFLTYTWTYERAWGKAKDFELKDEAPIKPRFDPRLLPREQLEIVQYALRLMVGAMRGPGETSEIEAEPD
jgi:hypothetical protein